jgi:hypothetical protein
MSDFQFEITKNRIPALIKIVNQQREPGTKHDVFEPIAQDAGYQLLRMFKVAAPVGEVEQDYTIQRSTGPLNISHGRPSLRIWGKTLADSWENPRVQPIFSGAKVQIGTSTGLAGLLLSGSPKHDMPTQGGPFMSFWWTKMGRPAIYSTISHPGFPPRSWTEREYLFRGQTMMIGFLNKGFRQILQPIKDFFS